MQLDLYCYECQIARQRRAVDNMPDREAARQYLLDCLQILHDAPDGVAAPWLTPRFTEAWNRHFPPVDRYAQNKKDSNAYALSREPKIAAAIAAAPDPLYAALTYSRVGNYLDFAALGDSVSFDELDALTEQALADPVDAAEYERFCAELETAQRLLLLTDNAGEVVYDKLLLSELHRRFPHLELIAGVRGANALNDATREDAHEVGLDRVARIIDNGCGIPGTQLSECSAAFRAEFAAADVILAKGQANVETLLGCGANIYYLFLCKCELFTRRFRVPKLTGMFLNERRQ